jgi:hypothetical protein
MHCAINSTKMRVYTSTKLFQREITVRNGNVMIAKKVGKLRCGIRQKNCEKLIVTIENLKYVPELWMNLSSIGKALKNDFNGGSSSACMLTLVQSKELASVDLNFGRCSLMIFRVVVGATFEEKG